MDIPAGDGIRPIHLPDGRIGYALEYEIVDEPMDEEGVEPTPDLEAEAEGLHAQLMGDPKSAVGRLEELARLYPRVPSLMNWLTVAYTAAGRVAEAEATTDRLVAGFPNYLFGRLAKADRFLRAGQLDRVLEPLNGFADLKLIYPHRSRFHVSEAVGLWRLAGELMVQRGDYDAADRYLKSMQAYAPDHPMTRQLATRLSTLVLLKGLARMGEARGGRGRKQANAKVVKKAAKRPPHRKRGG